MKNCTHDWMVNKRHSAFGLHNINALLKCRHCKAEAYLGLTPIDKFEVRGEKIKNYYYKGEVHEVSVPQL